MSRNNRAVDTYDVGDSIEALFDGDGSEYYPAVILHRYDNGTQTTYHVRYDDGDENENVPSGDIRKISSNAVESSTQLNNLNHNPLKQMNDQENEIMNALTEGIKAAINLSQNRKDLLKKLDSDLAAKEIKLEANFRARVKQLHEEIDQKKNEDKKKLEEEYSKLGKEKEALAESQRILENEKDKFKVERDETWRTNEKLEKEKKGLLDSIEELKKDQEDKLKTEADRVAIENQVKVDALTLNLAASAQVALGEVQNKVLELETKVKHYEAEIATLKDKEKEKEKALRQKDVITKTLTREKDDLFSKYEKEKNDMLLIHEQKIHNFRKEADIQINTKTSEIAQNYAILRARFAEEEKKLITAENSRKDIALQLEASLNTADQLRTQMESLLKNRDTMKEDFERHGTEWRMFFESNIEALRKQYHDVISVRVQSWTNTHDQNITTKIAELLNELNYMTVARYPYPKYNFLQFNDEMMPNEANISADYSHEPGDQPSYYQSNYIPQTPENLHMSRQPSPIKSSDHHNHRVPSPKIQYDNSYDYGNATNNYHNTTFTATEYSVKPQIRYPNIYDTKHPSETGGTQPINSGGFSPESQRERDRDRDRERDTPSSQPNHYPRNNQQPMHHQEPEPSNSAVNYPFAYFTPRAQSARPQSAPSSRPYGWKPNYRKATNKNRRDHRIAPS